MLQRPGEVRSHWLLMSLMVHKSLGANPPLRGECQSSSEGILAPRKPRLDLPRREPSSRAGGEKNKLHLD